MVKKRLLKTIVSLACIIALVMPNISVVLAEGLTNEKNNSVNTAKLKVRPYHEGGAESTDSLPTNYKYDKGNYKYRFGGSTGTVVYKIIREDDYDNATGDYLYSDAFYCLNCEASFPSVKNDEIIDSIEYSRTIEDFFAEKPTSLGLSDGDYNSLCWLMDNMYLRKQMSTKQRTEQKNRLIQNAFADIINDTTTENVTSIDNIKSTVTDDDIEVVQQWAIWYFTNKQTLQKVPIEDTLPIIEKNLPNANPDSINNSTEYEWMNILYQYLIKTASSHSGDFSVSSSGNAPTIANKNVTCEVEGSYYKVGPFEVTAPEGMSSSDCTITLTDGTSEIISSKYTIRDENGNEINKKVGEIFNTKYYVYIPTSEKIENVKLNLSYTKFGTKASIWTASDPTYQTLVLLTKEGDTITDSAIANITPEADLALRKYIIAVGDEDVTDRIPDVDIADLQSGRSTTATYKHQKAPVEVKKGDTVTYRISVYNEGNLPVSSVAIADYLPTGLVLDENSSVNQRYGWQTREVAGGTVAVASFSVDLPAFSNNNLQAINVEIVCKVTGDIAKGSILTNYAQIIDDDIEDRDSTTTSKDSDMKSSDYIGTSGETDLTKNNFFYTGNQDDDDFEKVILAGQAFDLSLQKFITKVNGEQVNPSREPNYSTEPLKNGLTDAEFEQVKTPVKVEIGDIVTYTIRVYNEGDTDGYAESITDYLPEGLGFLVNYTDNIDNSWAISETSRLMQLGDIKNGTKNLKLDDFTGVTDLEKADVVVGDVTSTLRSSKNSNNLIKAFDGSNTLDSQDVEITCIVLDSGALTNYAEITADSDADGNEVEDRDSTPGNELFDEDDLDYESLTTKNFDLALQKFITGLNGKEITDREPSVEQDDYGKFIYNHPETPLDVNNGDSVTYTIRVYNEGDTAGYAAEIADDIPNGLVFDSSNPINQAYGWVMYDASGNVTTDSSKAVEIRTDYLSKEKSEARGEDALIQSYYCIDVQVVFTVDAKTADSVIINTAEITEDTDENGNEIEDVDSVPDNKKDGEDDIDKERVHVGYFDLALVKDLSKAIVIVGNNTTEYNAKPGELLKVEVNRKKVNSTIVKFAYNITVTNEGTIPGYVREVKDYIPEGLEFVESDNTNWKSVSNNVITTSALENTLLNPGESATVEVVLRWINGEDNLGLKTNVAEISADYNDANDIDDIDSTPDNKVDGEDDIDSADVILSISTGSTPKYIILWTSILTIMGTGIATIKKFVL